jgi:hypothetical protein
MKIALIGNMNNNNFSILRYLRDLGIEADLLLMTDDSVGLSSHFNIDADTWHEEKWAPFIRHLPISAGLGQLFSYSFGWKLVAGIISTWRKLKGDESFIFWQTSTRTKRSKVKNILLEYDCRIGSGLTPAILNTMEVPLEIFIPYAIGVEYIGDPEFLNKINSKNPITRIMAKKVVKMQIKGVRHCKCAINAETGKTQDILSSLGIITHNFLIPIINKMETHNEEIYSAQLQSIINDLKKYSFVLLCHSRHIWVNSDFNDEDWKRITKNSDWPIRAFAKFLISRPNTNSKLVMFRYGTDYIRSIELCSELGITENVIWLPKMARKEIMVLLKKVDIGIGEFYLDDVIFGGAGMEILASGLPLIQGSMKYNSLAGDRPPYCEAKNETDIYNHLLRLYDNQSLKRSLGIEGEKWFNNNICKLSLDKLISVIKNASH